MTTDQTTRSARRTKPDAKAPTPSAESTAPPDLDTRIYKTVFKSIMDQRLTPGTQLPESALCE
jgi:DNA-binding GntR family transcriptional regulator